MTRSRQTSSSGTSTYPQTSFNRGEFSPLMYGQYQYQYRTQAVASSTNLIPLKQGPLTRRGGTSYIHNVKNSDNRTTLLEYKFSNTVSYIIEMGDQYFRFYTNRSPVFTDGLTITAISKATSCTVTYSGSDTLANGDEVYLSGIVGMTELNDKYYLVSGINTGANTFILTDIDGNVVNSSSFTTYVSGGTVFEIYTVSSPYTQANLFDSNSVRQVHFVQSASVLYMFSDKYPPAALTRLSNNSWTYTVLTLIDGPYLDINVTTTTMTMTGTSGTVTLTVSSTTGVNGGSGFVSTDVGRSVRIRDSANQWVWLVITAVGSTTSVSATIQTGFTTSGASATTFWRLGAFSNTTGWPRTGNFFQERMVLGGTSSLPDYWVMTETAGYSPTTLSFAPSPKDGIVTDSNSIFGTLPSRTVNSIQAISPDQTGCIVFTGDQEWTIKGGGNGGVITPSNAQATPITSNGCAYIQPITISSGILYVQNARRKILAGTYAYEVDRIDSLDVTVVSEHMTYTGICDVAYQQEPINSMWMCTTNGVLLGMTYYPSESVVGMHKHVIGGSIGVEGGDAVVESVAVKPSDDGARDEVWIIVKRLINGEFRRYIEVIERYYESDMDVQVSQFVDSSLVYSGAATSVITGLEHLEGETVSILAGGAMHPELVVENGSITLNDEYTKVVVGLKAPWEVQTLDIVDTGDEGLGIGIPKRVVAVAAKLLNSVAINYNGILEAIGLPQGIQYGVPPSLISRDTEEVPYSASTSLSTSVTLSDNSAFPVTILAIKTRYEYGSK